VKGLAKFSSVAIRVGIVRAVTAIYQPHTLQRQNTPKHAKQPPTAAVAIRLHAKYYHESKRTRLMS
jgi:hypothetical protein